MSCKLFVKRGLVASVLVVLVLSAGCGKASKKKSALLKLVPQDSAVCIVVNDMDKLLANLDEYMVDLNPSQMPLKSTALKSVAAMIGNPEMDGVAMTGSFGVFAKLKIDELPETPVGPNQMALIGILIPVSDYATFITKSVTLVEADQKGLSVLKLGPMSVFVKDVGKYALLSMTADADEFLALVKSVTDGKGVWDALSAADANDAVSKSAWLYGNMKVADKILGAKVDEGFEKMSISMVEAQKMTGQKMNVKLVNTGLNIYKAFIKKGLAEIDVLSIGAVVSPDKILLNTAATAKKGSDLAGMMKGSNFSVTKSSMLNYFEEDAIMNGAMVFDKKQLQKMNELIWDVISDVTKKEDAAFIKDIKSLSSDYTEAMGESFAFSMREGTVAAGAFPFGVTYVYEIKDEALYNKAMDKSVKIIEAGAIKNFYKEFGMDMDLSIKRGTDKYKDVSIDAMSITMKFEGLDPQSAAVMNGIYAGGLHARMALVSGKLVYVLGGDVDKDIRSLIDSVKAGGSKKISKEARRALKDLPSGADTDYFGTYNYVRLMKASMSMMGGVKGVEGGPSPKIAASTAKAFDFPTKSSLVFDSKSEDGRSNTEIVVPKLHMQELTGAFKAMMKIQMQNMQRGMTPPPAVK